MQLLLDRASSIPLYVQIRNQIRQLISAGQLPVGERLPSERALAKSLDVNRTTVINAYRELAEEGLLVGEVGRGTIVAELPRSGIEGELIEGLISWGDIFAPLGANLHTIAHMAPFAVADYPEDAIAFTAGESTPELYPVGEIATLFQEILETRQADALRLSPPEGRAELRSIVAQRLSGSGMTIDPERVAIISGRHQAWSRLAQLLLQPGDTIVCEAPAPLLPIAIIRGAGAQVVGVPIDGDGMQTSRLDVVLERYEPKFILTMPTIQTPSGVTMTMDRRHDLLAVAHRHRVPIVEFDMFSEMWYDEPPPPPLIALDTTSSVVHIGSWSGFLLPGLQVAWLVGPIPLIENIVAQTQLQDNAAATICQLVLAAFAERGLLPSYLDTLRKEYRRRFEEMIHAIDNHWPAGTVYTRPHGGKQIWVRLPEGLSAEHLLNRASSSKVFFRPGHVFHIDTARGSEWILLNFAETSAQEVGEGMRRLGSAARALLAERPQRRVS